MDAFHPLDWIAIVGYVVVALVVGSWLSRRASRSTGDFYLAGRSLPWWISGTSLVATSFAADTPLFVAGLVRTQGVQGNWLWWGFAVGGALLFVLLGAWWRRTGLTTSAELMELRYSGPQARVLRGFYGAYHSLLTNTLVLVWVLLAMLKIVRAVLGVDDTSYDLAIVGGSLALALSYSMLAGLWGVVITDLFQFTLAMVGALVLAWKAVEATGGLTVMRETLQRQHPEALALFPAPGPGGWLDATFWTQGFTAFLVTVGVLGVFNKNADGSPHAVQRFLASRNGGHARGAALWFHLAHYCLRPWPWILVGLASLILLGDADLPQILQADGSFVPDHEASYPILMRQLLGPGLFGLLCASFLAAFMSTLDTHFNNASAYAVNDLYRRFLVPARGERHYVNVGRLVELGVGLLAAGFALFADSIRDLFLLSLALFGGVGPAMLLRWFWWRANAWTEVAALVSSTALTVLFRVLPASVWPAAPFNGWQAGTAWAFEGQYLLIVAISTVAMLAATLLTAPVDRAVLRAFHARVQPVGRWGPVADSAVRAPWLALLLAWAGGVALVLGLLIATGTLLLGREGFWPWLGVTVAGGAALFWSWPRTVPSLPAGEEPT